MSECVRPELEQYDNSAPIITDVYLSVGYKIDPTDPRGYSSNWLLCFTTNIDGTTKIRWGLLPDPATWTYDDIIDGAFVTDHTVPVAGGMHNGGVFYYQAWSQSRDGLWGHSEVVKDFDNAVIHQPPIIP
jgi:hypothetical protein